MSMMFADKSMRCRDCSTDFVWTAGEQEFYATKGLLNQPTRCPSCRQLARTARQGAGTGRPREFFPVVCNRCGIQTQVPFMPRADRPVYCSACYDAVRADQVSLGTS